MKKIISLLVFCLVFYGVTALANEEAYDVDQVLEKIYQSVFESPGISAQITISYLQNNRENVSVANLKYSGQHGLLRFELVEPVFLAGSITVVDQNAKISKTYNPVSDLIMVSDLENMDMQGEFSFSITGDITTLFTFEGMEAKIDNITVSDQGLKYILRIDVSETQYLEVTVDSHLWLPVNIQIYDQGVYVGCIKLSDVKLNENFDASDIAALPNVREVRFQSLKGNFYET